MDDSSMDLTNVVCHSASEVKQLLTVKENEAIIQENYELKKRIQCLEKVNEDIESELSFVTRKKLQEKTNYSDLQSELSAASLKIKQLESQLEEEKCQVERLMNVIEENKSKHVEVSTVVVPDQEQLNILTGQIVNLEVLRDEDEILKQQLTQEKSDCMHFIDQLKSEIKTLQTELTDVKEILNQKTEDHHTLHVNLESLREEKLLLDAELQMLKSSNNAGSRGNSLFAEVEENCQKAVGQRELLKLKYLNLKKVLNQKQSENNKLKSEIVQIRREEKDDEKTIHRDYSVLINTLKQRNSELEVEVKTLKRKLEKHPIIVTEGDLQNFQVVNSILDGVRKDAKALQEELDTRGSNYVLQGHQLFESQKENRRLKAFNKKLQSDKDELKLKLDIINSGKENVEDGISPPATEIAIEYQKQKTVKFQEALIIHNRSRNDEESKEIQE